jgi:hypothetical protein
MARPSFNSIAAIIGPGRHPGIVTPEGFDPGRDPGLSGWPFLETLLRRVWPFLENAPAPRFSGSRCTWPE